MKELIIKENEHNQRMDKFLKKYLSKASAGFIYKMLRKKRVKLNNSKAKPEDILKKGDKIQLYLAPETIDKFQEEKEVDVIPVTFDIAYEDSNIILINKPKGLLSQATSSDSNDSVVKQLISYLYKNKEYDPNKEKTFVPSICNRLDRNTSGIIIGGKNYTTLQIMNEAIKEGKIKKFYLSLVKGEVTEEKELKGYLTKNPKDNTVNITLDKVKGAKSIHTVIRPMAIKNGFTLLEIELITGRTHQIRAHLSIIGHPVVGDFKYGDKKINNKFKNEYNLKSQFLHAYKIVFTDLRKPLNYLNKKEFVSEIGNELEIIKKSVF